jgi:hypothetical protein
LELHISKRQSKGFLGVKLEITSSVELTDEEEKLLRKYKAGRDRLGSWSFHPSLLWGSQYVTVDKLINERTSKWSKIEDLNEDEKIIRGSYEDLKKKIEELKKFEKETS